MKRVRMLLRVSSDQQLDADGDLYVQRKIVQEYIKKQEAWIWDGKEYFEGSKSAYKNMSSDREILQLILNDAKRKEFDILVLYKDDRIGRLMWDTSVYIMNLKEAGVDVYTVKDGCITPDSDDILGQMMLTFRYANAQKSSADTGMRVKDTAQKLVEKGKFMGGKAPYGYRLEYSGEISKHGRALKTLVIVKEQAEVVKYIYNLSLNKEYGSSKIANELNRNDRYKNMAPNDIWKSGTITSILTNPIYTGRTAYKRRERSGSKYHRLEREEWIIAAERNDSIAIIEDDIWKRTQDKRKKRGSKYTKKIENENIIALKRNDGSLPLIDVIYCGYCDGKLRNGSKYNYWTIKGTGEKRTSKIPVYRCQNAQNGMIHDGTAQFRADQIEPVIFEFLVIYIEKIMENEDIFKIIEKRIDMHRILQERELMKDKAELEKVRENIGILEEKLPVAMQGKYDLSVEDMVLLIRKQKKIYKQKKALVMEKELKQNRMLCERSDERRPCISTWREVFSNADKETKRVLVNRLVDRIEVKKENIVIKLKISNIFQ